MHPLEEAFGAACKESGISEDQQKAIHAFLAPLRTKHPVTYEHYLHSLRVALTTCAIAKYRNWHPKPALFAGALHDIGKSLVPIQVLGKTDSWTAHDQRIIRRHVLDGYRLLCGKFDFSAEVMVWHHKFKKNGYPRVIPPMLHMHREGVAKRIVWYGRMLALADVYDAFHRLNSKWGDRALTGEEIKAKMIYLNRDVRGLVRNLYEANIFTVES